MIRYFKLISIYSLGIISKYTKYLSKLLYFLPIFEYLLKKNQTEFDFNEKYVPSFVDF